MSAGGRAGGRTGGRTVESVVSDDLAGERFDRAVAVLADVPRSVARRLVDAGAATLDGAVVAGRHRVAGGSTLRVEVPPDEPSLRPEPVAFDVVYEDEAVLVVDKPPGVVVHPGAGNRTGTLAAGLAHRFEDLAALGEEHRWGIVHRLDRDTSGCLVVARTPPAYRALQRALKRHEVGRRYRALVVGVLEPVTGTIEAPIGRDPDRPIRMAVRRDGRPARTHVRRLAAWSDPEVSLLEVRLETGRTHQIRVHLASVGHAVAGDSTYGRGPVAGLDLRRTFLHAAGISFGHPVSGAKVEVSAPLPADLASVLARLGPPVEGER